MKCCEQQLHRSAQENPGQRANKGSGTPRVEGHYRGSGLVQSSLWTAVHRLESTVRYLGIEVDDALELSEQTEI